MSSAQVERLEGLLARVQTNRQQARASNGAGTSAVAATPQLPAPQLSAPPLAAARPTSSPIESAVESRLSNVPVARPIAPAPTAPAMSAPLAAPVAKAAPQLAAKAPEIAVARSIPVAGAQVDANEPARVVTSPAPPSAPIAHATSPHPVMDGASFGELLRRSLALRPR